MRTFRLTDEETGSESKDTQLLNVVSKAQTRSLVSKSRAASRILDGLSCS